MRCVHISDLYIFATANQGTYGMKLLGACVKINQNSKRNFNRMQNYISMEKKFKEYQPNQLMLLPPCISDWLPEDHPVHYISEVVEDLDLSAIYQNYRGRRGQPPYEPKMMVKIFIAGERPHGFWKRSTFDRDAAFCFGYGCLKRRNDGFLQTFRAKHAVKTGE